MKNGPSAICFQVQLTYSYSMVNPFVCNKLNKHWIRLEGILFEIAFYVWISKFLYIGNHNNREQLQLNIQQLQPPTSWKINVRQTKIERTNCGLRQYRYDECFVRAVLWPLYIGASVVRAGMQKGKNMLRQHRITLLCLPVCARWILID